MTTTFVELAHTSIQDYSARSYLAKCHTDVRHDGYNPACLDDQNKIKEKTKSKTPGNLHKQGTREKANTNDGNVQYTDGEPSTTHNTTGSARPDD